jgi:hypothetical protein
MSTTQSGGLPEDTVDLGALPTHDDLDTVPPTDVQIDTPFAVQVGVLLREMINREMGDAEFGEYVQTVEAYTKKIPDAQAQATATQELARVRFGRSMRKVTKLVNTIQSTGEATAAEKTEMRGYLDAVNTVPLDHSITAREQMILRLANKLIG